MIVIILVTLLIYCFVAIIGAFITSIVETNRDDKITLTE